jgi:PilZ domain
MSHNGLSAETGRPDASSELRQQETHSLPADPNAASVAMAATAARHYTDLQSAVRFPIKLPISVKSKSGESQTETQNISANGVLFRVDGEMPVGAPVDFTISFPCDVLGTDSDVRVDCRGRVVRTFEDDGRRGVGVVIDEYHFDRH